MDNYLRLVQEEWFSRLPGEANTSFRFISAPTFTGLPHTPEQLAKAHYPREASSDRKPIITHEGIRTFERVVAIAPNLLPLPGFLELLHQPEGDQEFVVRNVNGNFPVAIVCYEDTLRALARGEKTLELPHKPLESSEVFASRDQDPSWLFAVKDDWRIPLDTFRTAKVLDVGDVTQGRAYMYWPLWFIEQLNAPIGAFARSLTIGTDGEAPLAKPDSDHYTLHDIDVIAVTTDRWKSVQKLLASTRQQLGDGVGITIAVQSRSSVRWRWLARRYRATLLHVAEDSGLAWSRNHAVNNTHRPLIFLMDDDFQLDERCLINDALNILELYPEISVLGGNLLDVETWGDGRGAEVSQGFAMKMITGEPDIAWLRLEDAPRQRHFINPVHYIEYADIVDNFALMKRKDVFDQGVFWNPELKIGAEHQDLYIRLKRIGKATVARTNALKVRNVRVQSRRFRAMRSRVDRFFEIFFRDLGLGSFTIVGERQRVRAQDGGHAYLENTQLIPRYIQRQGKP